MFGLVIDVVCIWVCQFCFVMVLMNFCRWIYGRIRVARAGKWRDRWLIDHFGQAGRDRWLLNRTSCWVLWECRQLERDHKNWPNKKSYKRYHDFQARHAPCLDGGICFTRGSNGDTIGTVEGDFGGPISFGYHQGYRWCPPWGEDFFHYYAEHSSELRRSLGSGIHAEPSSLNWFAAGFYDKGLRILIAETAAWRFDQKRQGKWKLTVPSDVIQLGFNYKEIADLADVFIMEHGDPIKYSFEQAKKGISL